MDIEQLRTLVTVVDEGTFDRAATRLHVSPPAVSQRIRALEAQWGHVLVQRVVPVRLTEPGTEVLRMARQILALHGDTQETLGLGTAADPDSAIPTTPYQLRVAVNADSLATWFRPALADLGSPTVGSGGRAVTVHVNVEDQDHSLALLQAGSVAAAITTAERTVTGCRSIALGQMVYQPCMAPSLLKAVPVEGVADLQRLPVVVFNDKDDLQEAQLRKLGSGARPPEHRVPSSEAFVRAVADGIGWGMVPTLQMQGAAFAAIDTPLVPVPGLSQESVSLYLQRWKTPLPALERLEHLVRDCAQHHL